MSHFPSFTPTFHKKPYDAISPLKSEHSVSGKTVVITGASKGIGAAVAKAFVLANAANVVLLGRKESDLANVKSSLEATISSSSSKPTHIHTFVADVIDQSATDKAFETVANTIGPIDIFVNNAGAAGDACPTSQVRIDTFWRDFEVNVKGALISTQAFLRHTDKDRKPILINVSAGSALMKSWADRASYNTSKLAAIRIFDHVETENPWLRVHQLHPGIFKTTLAGDMTHVPDEFWEDIDLSGHFIVWLCSPDAEFLKGRFVWSEWDVEEMKARKQEILDNPNLLNLTLNGFPWDGPPKRVE